MGSFIKVFDKCAVCFPQIGAIVSIHLSIILSQLLCDRTYDVVNPAQKTINAKQQTINDNFIFVAWPGGVVPLQHIIYKNSLNRMTSKSDLRSEFQMGSFVKVFIRCVFVFSSNWSNIRLHNITCLVQNTNLVGLICRNICAVLSARGF